MNFITEGEVSAFALRFLFGAAVDKSATTSNGLVGLLATLKAAFSVAFRASSPKFF